MKKLFYLPLMLGAMAVAFTSCSDDDNGSTSASLLITSNLTPNDAPGVSRVMAETWGADEQSHVVAYASLGTLGFNLLLDATPHASTVAAIDDILGWDVSDIFTVSNSNARIAAVWELYGFTSATGPFLDADFAGFIYRDGVLGSGDNIVRGDEVFIYADRDVSITGIDQFGPFRDIMNMNLEQGWNRVFMLFSESTEGGQRIEIYEWTTTPLAGMVWTWFFEPADDNGEPTSTAMSAQENSAEARIMERVTQRRNARR